MPDTPTTLSGTYGVVHRVRTGGAIGEYRAMNGTVAITLQAEDAMAVVREWLTDDEVRAHIDRLTAILAAPAVRHPEPEETTDHA